MIAKLHVISVYLIFQYTNIMLDNIIRMETDTFSAVMPSRLCNLKHAEYLSNVSVWCSSNSNGQKWLRILLTEDMKIPTLTVLMYCYLETHPDVL